MLAAAVVAVAVAGCEPCYSGKCLSSHTVPSGNLGSAYNYPSCGHLGNQYRHPTRLFDLWSLPSSEQLATNFTAGEFMQAHKGRFGIAAPKLVSSMQKIRNWVGGPITISSGYRSPGYNSGVPNAATCSRHQWGDAADFQSSHTSLTNLYNRCGVEGAGFRKLYSGHVHCDWRNSALNSGFFGGANGAAANQSSLAVENVDDAIESGGMIDLGDRLVPRQVLLNVGEALTTSKVDYDEGEPMREWTAFDADGNVIAEATADTFEAPPGTAKLTVLIGAELELIQNF